ncbi:MAG: helix-turn-helix domain-containing protein [Prevotella sp.]|nr:helix-turn-helix domain-containing protein [Prevotella sp.]
MRRRLYGLFLLACVLKSTCAYNIKHIQGLTNSFVLSVEQKPSGEMLFGTLDGLDGYDGVRVWSADTHGKNSIRGRVVENVMCVNGNQTWVLTNYGLNVFTRYKKEYKFFSQFAGLRKMKRNPRGDGFILDNGRLCYMGPDGNFHSLSLGLGDNVPWPCDYVVTDHQVLVFQNSRIMTYELLRHADGTYQIRRYHQRAANIRIAVESHDKEYIIDDQGMLLTYSYATRRFQKLFSLSHELATRGSINDIVEFNGELLIAFGTGGMISVVLPKGPDDTPKITDLNINTGVFCLTKDRYNDIVWIGTDGEGVLMLSDEAYTYCTYTGKSIFTKQQQAIRALLLDADNTLWVGSKGDGLLRVPHFSTANSQSLPQGTHFNDATPGLESRNIFSILDSKDGQHIWIGHDRGVSCYDRKSQRFIRMSLPGYAANVMAMAERDGRLWLAALGNGIVSAHIDQKNGQPELSDVKSYRLDGGSMSSNYFFCMAEGPQGYLLFGNRGKGLYKLKGDILEHVPFGDTEKTPNINDVFALRNIANNLWIGTSAGIIILDHKGTVKHIDTIHGLPSNTIHAFTLSSHGEVWASTSAGLAALSLQGDVIKVVDSNTIPGFKEYCDGAAYHAGNTLLFGSINGLAAISYDAHATPCANKLQIDFNRLSIQGIQQDINDFMDPEAVVSTLRLDHQQNFFTIGVATYDYLGGSMLDYYYRLSASDEWTANGHSNQFTFSDMQPGHYTLYVKTRNISTGKESGEALLHIIITPPWYRRWWAYAFYMCCAAIVGWLLRRWWQQHRKHEMEVAQQQMQIASEQQSSASGSFSDALIEKEQHDFLEEVTEAVDKHIGNSHLDAEMLANILKISRRNLYRKFETAQLPPVKEFIKAYRVKTAARLLASTHMTISEVMYKTGYDTQSTFYKEFRRHFNQTPKAYREQQQSKNNTL